MLNDCFIGLRGVTWLFLLTAMTACARMSPSTAVAPLGGEVQIRANETQLIKLKPGVSPQAVADGLGVRYLGQLGLGVHRFGVGQTRVAGSVRGAVWAEPERGIDLERPKGLDVRAGVMRRTNEAVMPNDPLWPVQHGWRLCSLAGVWRTVRGMPETVVAVIDSGIDGNHPDLAGQVLPGWDLTVPNGAPGGHEDPYGHGTHVAGIIAAQADNGVGIAGLAPGVKLLPVRIFNRFGHSTSGASMAAIVWAVDHGARVINASWGSTLESQAMRDALRYAAQKNVLVVAAVGNSGKNIPSYPGADVDALGVAASTDRDGWATFSSFGEWVDLAAPGEGIVSTYPIALGTGYRVMSGTSMATPFVSAAAALLSSAHPDWTAQRLRETLIATADDIVQTGVDPYAGHGRINLTRALAAELKTR